MTPARERQSEFLPVEADLAQHFSGSQMPIKASQHQGNVLDKALEVLNQLTEGNRLVGIISHVDKLDESIPQKVRVRGGDKGSTLSLELA